MSSLCLDKNVAGLPPDGTFSSSQKFRKRQNRLVKHLHVCRTVTKLQIHFCLSRAG
uniref:Uncharacterized protein n=1 Tax=Anguilla anguilla TaxID=7936 RepID=A0A0E9WRB8_ANGAN